MELPQYTLYLSIKRILVPKAITLMCLGGILYFGVWLNLMILNIYIPPEVHLYIILGIFVLIIIQAILNYLKYSSYRYLFYKDRLIFQGKKDIVIIYSEIQNLEFKKDSLDSIFNTGTINLLPIHKMKYIENTNQVYFYLQKLLDYSRQMTGYYRQQQTNYNQPYYQQQLR